VLTNNKINKQCDVPKFSTDNAIDTVMNEVRAMLIDIAHDDVQIRTSMDYASHCTYVNTTVVNVCNSIALLENIKVPIKAFDYIYFKDRTTQKIHRTTVMGRDSTTKFVKVHFDDLVNASN